MQAVILAAGAGQRLRPVTLTRSKATVPVCGRTMIERVLDSLRAGGVSDFVVVVREPGDDVERRCAAWAGDARVRFAYQPERRGMGDALRRAAPLLHGPFVLSACDSIVEDADVTRLLAHHAARRANATLALLRVPSPEAVSRTGIVAFDGEWVSHIVEKPRPEEAPSDLGSLPLYVFEPRLLDYLPEIQPSPRGEIELQDAILMLILRDGRVAGYLAERRWQVTAAADLLTVNQAFLARGNTRDDPRATCHGPVWVDPGADLGREVTLGPNVVLEAGAQVGDRAALANCVVLQGGIVPADARLEGEVVAPG